MLYWWNEISSIENKSGVYAWYYLPEITEYDLLEAIKKIKEGNKFEDKSNSLNIARDFLEQFIFRYFQEEPYKANLQGPLKPQYAGSLHHQMTISDSLVSRIVENPDRLRSIKSVLEKTVPDFSSPLYIGMSKTLKDRLAYHQKLVVEYSSWNTISDDFPVDSQSVYLKDEDRDKNFAMRVCKRGIPPTRLAVAIRTLDDSISDICVDIENILNRIYYPLLGRN